MPLSERQLQVERHAILTHQEAVQRVRAKVKDFVTRQWNGLTAWRDADIEAFTQAVVPVVESGMRSVAQLTDAYLASMARMAGKTPLPAGLPPGYEELRQGVSIQEVYTRPGVTVWTALSEGKTIEEATRLGLMRALDISGTDLQLARFRMAERHFNANPGIVGYRRVLSGAENCALCVLASTQRYHRINKIAIHPGCDCGVASIWGDHDPGQVLNAEVAERIQNTMRESGLDTHATWDGKKDRVMCDLMVREHGEYGPTLGWRDHSFTGPSDI
jgi:hypothetical protein